MQFELTDIARRLANIIRVGVISEVDFAAARVRVTSGSLLTAPLPWLTDRAGSDRSWWAPSVGEQVLVLSPSGELAQGVVLPGIYQTSKPAPAASGDMHRTVYQDGSVVEYDNGAHQLRATVGLSSITMNQSAITLASNGSTLVLDSSGVAINGTQVSLN